MQQPTPQSDQMAAQQLQQQMVLCPVRVVYETQILVQPGDQIQPNQTLFINPQNPPPWAQARPVQNQVIYVQQMPGNIVPNLPTHMDQNQLYLHQYPGYQQGMQMIPQQMVQMQENRQNAIQMQNMIHQNMLPNFQQALTANMGQNIQTLPDRTIQQANYGQIQQNVANIQMSQSQVNLANNNMARTNEAITNAQNQIQQQYAPKVEMKPTFIGQISQSPNIGRPQPQVLTVNPIQNMPQTSTVQTFSPIVRPIKTETVSSPINPPTYVNAAQNTQVTRVRKVSPTAQLHKPPPTIGIRSIGQTQTYRPIQPRPQFRAALPNYSTLEPINQGNSMPLLNQNVISINSNMPVQNASANSISIMRTDEGNMNRKRKSESPDEIHKKMAAIQVNMANPIKQISDMTKRSSEIGVGPSPVQRNQVTITQSILQQNNMKMDINQPVFSNVQPAEVKGMPYLMPNVQQSMNVPAPSLDPIEPQNSLQSKEGLPNMLEKEKLIRNTVFTQAKGRVLTDKETSGILTEPTSVIPESVSALKEITVTPKNPIAENSETHVKLEQSEEVPQEATIKIEPPANAIKDENKDIKKRVDAKVKRKEPIKEEKKEPSDMKVSLNTTNNKGMFPMDRAVKQEKDYILTHVLDGIVIQESNVAFPIREPLIKRITQSTAQVNLEATKKEDNSVTKKEVALKEKETKHSAESVSAKEELEQDDNPFSNLSAATVKSWTTHQLSSHLSRRGWDDTAALFAEHEIDGESLYLVSKSQLQTIGVKEEQADLICGFVKS